MTRYGKSTLMKSTLAQDITEDERQAALREFREREELTSGAADLTGV